MLTKYVDRSDRGTCILFGDGAGAVLLQASDDDDSISPNDVLLFSAFGAGLTWGAGVVRW